MSTISKKMLDELIPLAIDVITKLNFKVNGTVSKTYHGYFSSFGADMINASPLAAAIFAEDSSKKETDSATGTKEDRTLVPLAILELLKKKFYPNASENKLSSLIISRSTNGILPSICVDYILASAIALKIALRTFKKS